MKLLAVDGNSVLNRAFYGVKPLSTREGIFTNAIFGFLNILARVSEEVKPDAVAIAFDVKAPTFRHKHYADYKGTRKGMPEELAMQMPYLKEILTALGYHLVELAGYEADDILGTFAQRCTDRGDECIIATGDRDSLQLINPKVSVRLTSTLGGKATSVIYDEAMVQEKYQTTPDHLIDIKALMGDSSDNVPGVPGIGEKTAISLISRYETIEQIYDNLETIEVTPSVRKKLEAGKDSAFLSKYLVTILRDVPIDADPEHYCKQAMDKIAAYRLFSKLEMHTMIQRYRLWDVAEQAEAMSVPAEESNEQPQSAQRTWIVSERDLAAFADAKRLFITGRYTDGVLSGIAVSDGAAILFCDNQSKHFLPFIRSVFEQEDCEKVTDNCKPLYRFAQENDIRLNGVAFDCLLAAYLLNPAETDYSIQKLKAECQVIIPRIEGAIVENLVETVNNCGILPALYVKLSAEIVENNQQSLLQQVEIPLAEALSDMERIGFEIDVAALEQYGVELQERLEEIQKTIYTLCGETFNINSPRQLGEILFVKLELPSGKKTKTGYSTNAEVLEKLRGKHPVVDLVLEYRKLAKLNSTYVEGLRKAVGADGRIHTTFNQTETRTGRISSLEPNLQNIPIRTPEGSRLRQFFRAGGDMLLLDADYSQIELRVLAHIADDPGMQRAFRNGEDIHTATASQVFELPPELVTPIMRTRAKAVNFGIVYGIGAFSLSQDIGVSVREADRYIKSYLQNFAGVAAYMSRIIAEGEKQGYVTTLFARRRYLPELKASNKMVKAAGERIAMNTPIQGTAADIIKIAMVKVYQKLKEAGLRSRLILQVHDELIVECPPEELEQAKQILQQEMESAVKLKVDLSVDVHSGKTWLEAK